MFTFEISKVEVERKFSNSRPKLDKFLAVFGAWGLRLQKVAIFTPNGMHVLA